MRGWSSLSPCHYPSPTIVVTIHQPSGSRNPIPPSLLGSQLYNSRRPAPSCSEYKSAKWKSFQQPADFWWRSKLKALNFIVPCWCSVYDKLFIQKPKLFCYLWSVVKNPVWMRISSQHQTMESMLCSSRFFCRLPVIIIVQVTVCQKGLKCPFVLSLFSFLLNVRIEWLQ